MPSIIYYLPIINNIRNIDNNSLWTVRWLGSRTTDQTSKIRDLVVTNLQGFSLKRLADPKMLVVTLDCHLHFPDLPWWSVRDFHETESVTSRISSTGYLEATKKNKKIIIVIKLFLIILKTIISSNRNIFSDRFKNYKMLQIGKILYYLIALIYNIV